MTQWFISDLHLGDETLLKRRYSKSVDQMDAHLAACWDAKVGAEDEVWVLGDVARGRSEGYLRDWFEARSGTKHLILGNWDEWLTPDEWRLRVGFRSAWVERFLTIGGVNVLMSHYPYGHRRNEEDEYVLVHGHTHKPKKVSHAFNGSLMVHVGWDSWRRMVSENDIAKIIEKEQHGNVHDLRRAEQP